MKYIITLLIVFTMSACGLTQEISSNSTLHFPGEQNYTKARIYLDDENSTLINTTYLTIKDDTLSFMKEAEYYGQKGLNNKYFINDIFLIRVSKGTKAFEYAAVGAVSGGLGALLGVSNAGSDSNTEIDKNAAKNCVIGFTVVGAVIGGICGSTVHQWQTIYLKNHIGQNTKTKLMYNLAFNNHANTIMLNLTLTK